MITSIYDMIVVCLLLYLWSYKITVLLNNELKCLILKRSWWAKLGGESEGTFLA